MLSPLVIPLHGHAPLRRLNARLLPPPGAPRRAPARHGATDPVGLRAAGRGADPERSTPRLVVYHCVDDIAAQKGVDARRLPRRRGALRRARADLVIASARSLAERLRADRRARPVRAQRGGHAAVLHGARARTGGPRHRAARAAADRLPRRARRHEARPRPDRGPRSPAPRMEHRAGRPARARRPWHRPVGDRGRREHPHARPAPARRAAGGAARRGGGDHPVRDQPAHEQRLPDEGLRVPGRRAAGGGDAAARARGGRGRRRGRRRARPWPQRSTPSWPPTRRSCARSARAGPRATPGTRASRRSRRRCRERALRARDRAHAATRLRTRPAPLRDRPRARCGASARHRLFGVRRRRARSGVQRRRGLPPPSRRAEPRGEAARNVRCARSPAGFRAASRAESRPS